MPEQFKKPAICWHTDPDEAFLVGTRESVIAFARELLRLAESGCIEAQVAGVKLETPNSPSSLTEFGLDIVLQGVSFIESEENALKVVNHFRVLNGESPLVVEN